MNEELLQKLPEEYAALADRRQVMFEVADELAELPGAATRLGDALESAGLPGREWRSRDASLRLIERSLPDITVDRFMTRLAEFAAGTGPGWLHGNSQDLERFHRETRAIGRLAAHLRDIQGQNAQAPERTRRDRAIARVFSNARVLAALDDVVEILEDFRALQPFMAPLASDEWKSTFQAQRGTEPSVGSGPQGEHDIFSQPAAQAHTRLRDFARETQRLAPHQNRPKDLVMALLIAARSLLLPVLRRKPVVIALALVMVVAMGVGILAIRHQAAAGVVNNSRQNSGPSATVVSTPPAARATTSPVARPTATRAPVAAPQVTLTCKLNNTQGSSATLSIKNAGATSLTWQASANRGATVSPSQGKLSVGQTASAQVTPSSRHGLASNTITVTASNGTKSASSSVTCG